MSKWGWIHKNKVILLIFLLFTGLMYLNSCSDDKEILTEYPTENHDSETSNVALSDYPNGSANPNVFFWDDTIAIGDVPLTIQIPFMMRDTDDAYKAPIADVKPENFESFAVSLFGDSSLMMNRMLKKNDPDWLQMVCKAYQVEFHPEKVEIEQTEQAVTYDFSDVPLSDEDDSFFYHTYAGKIDSCHYLLFVGYRHDIHMVNICLYPENPGVLIGREDFRNIYWYNENEGGFISSGGTTIQNILESVKNRTIFDENKLKDSVKTFSDQIMTFLISKDDIKVVEADGSKTHVYYYSDVIAQTNEYEKAIKDGYVVEFNNSHLYRGHSLWYDGLQFQKKGTPECENKGRYIVRDEGVVSCELQIAYCISDRPEPVDVLNAQKLKKAFSEEIVEKMDVADLTGEELRCNSCTFMYYINDNGGTMDEEKKEYIPSWEYTILLSNGRTYKTVIQDATNGIILDIL